MVWRLAKVLRFPTDYAAAAAAASQNRQLPLALALAATGPASDLLELLAPSWLASSLHQCVARSRDGQLP